MWRGDSPGPSARGVHAGRARGPPGSSPLLLLVEARRATRTARDVRSLVLADQDGSRWDRSLIEEGHALVRSFLRRDQPGPYQIQAAIQQAVRTDAPTFEATDWGQVVALYEHLFAISPTRVVALNRAIAVGKLKGPATALALVDDLDLDGYHAFHAARGDLLSRLGNQAEAAAAFERAAELAPTEGERRFLRRGGRFGGGSG